MKEKSDQAVGTQGMLENWSVKRLAPHRSHLKRQTTKPTWEAGTTDRRWQKARPKTMRVVQGPGTGQKQEQ